MIMMMMMMMMMMMTTKTTMMMIITITIVNFRYFMRNDAIDEMAFSAIYNGLTTPEEHVSVSAKSLWGRNRVNPQRFWDRKDMFVHPFKLKGDLKITESRRFWCGNFLWNLKQAWMNGARKKKKKKKRGENEGE
jgi:hypothetical protein